MNDTANRTYLGVLAAPTANGKRAIAVALTGAVNLYHFVDAELDTDDEVVADWLWIAGINPDEIRNTVSPRFLIDEVLIPSIGAKTLIVHYQDMRIALVADLVAALAAKGRPSIVSGIELDGPIPQAANGAAGRRALALQSRYEAALDSARAAPAVHNISGEIDEEGRLVQSAVAVPFSRRGGSVLDEAEAFFVMTEILHIGGLATFAIEPGAAHSALKDLSNNIGLDVRIAA